MNWLVLSFALSLLSSFFLIQMAPKWGFVDIPEERKVHNVPTPRTGGLAMVLGGLVTLLVYAGFGHLRLNSPWQTLLAGTGFITLGALDDRFGFHPRRKVLWFALFALLAAWPWAFAGPSGSAYLLHFGTWAIHAPRWLAYPILTLWFMSVPNAVNIEDAINGYMGGFTLIILLVAAIRGVDVAIPIGALLAFLLLNWPKAKHFLGDAGSFGCGFFIAETVLRAGGSHDPIIALILAAPIAMDVAMGIIRRLRLHMSLFEADRLTLPHHIVNLCHQSHGLASPLLWVNAALIAFLGFHSILLCSSYLAVFALVLVFLNRASLRQARDHNATL